MKLFEYAIIYRPLQTKAQQEAGEAPKAELLVDVTRILANNEKEAQMVAARAIPQDFMNRLDRIDIAFRPF